MSVVTNNGSVYLNEDDVRELSWVAEVLEEGAALTYTELDDLAGVLRSKLPKPERALLSTYTVFDKNGAEYKNFDGTWYLVADGHALEVPYESIQGPRPLRLTVVE